MEKAIAIVFSFLIWDCFATLVSSLDMLKSGERLNSSAYLVSANKTFTLGFYTPENTNNSYLGIWYTNNSDYLKPVWLANRNRPIYNDSGILTVSRGGEMIIEHNGGEPIELYKSEKGINVTATLLDSGNFVVEEVNSNGSSVLWQSFDYPTDTLLPGMKLGFNHVTGRNWTITSWFSGNNPASGPFTLEWDTVRRRLIVKRRGVVYWGSGNLLYNNNEVGYWFEHMSYMDPAKPIYIFKNLSNRNEEYFTYSKFQTPVFTPRWDLTLQGNLFGYDYDTSDIMADVYFCYGYDTGNGCELWEQPVCRNRYESFTYTRGYFQYNGFDQYLYDNNSNLSQSDCRSNCWNDCKCVGFVDEENGCSYWRGENVASQRNNPSRITLFVLESENFVSVPSNSNQRRKKIMIRVALGLVPVLLVTSLIILQNYQQGKRKKKKELEELMMVEGYTETDEFENDGGRGLDLKMFTHAFIMASTDSFSFNNKLGEGGFGPVYKGKTPEGHEIAVKLLSQGSKQGLLEFKTELTLISKLQHRNLVKVLGFCIHGNEKMIVYDYMPNKSLDFFVFDPVKREELNWETRFKMIEGIAQGLLYLHKHSRLLIVHRDLKAGNILLDEKMNPKISDFGLARIFKENVPEINTSKRVGTYGYMAPEYAMHGTFSVKSDIYSFGVLVLEIVSGQRNKNFQNLEGPLTLVECAWDLWNQHAELDFVDPTLNTAGMNDQLRRCIHVALLCVQDRAIDRPPIEEVTSMLKAETMSLPLPKEPAFILRDNVDQKLAKIKIEKLSVNEVSISALDGR